MSARRKPQTGQRPGEPRKNSTFRRPDAQIPVETQEAQKQPCRRGRDVQIQSHTAVGLSAYSSGF